MPHHPHARPPGHRVGRGVHRRRPRRRSHVRARHRSRSARPGHRRRATATPSSSLDDRARARRRRASTPATGSSPRTPGSPRRGRGRRPRVHRARRPTRSAASAPRTRPAPRPPPPGCRCSPGTRPFVDVDAAVAAAGVVGFPLLVKSVAGGGGIGMLRVHRRRPSSPAVVDAGHAPEPRRRSATARCSSSGSSRAPATSRCRCSATARARVVVLGDRDCSLQRRRQKVVEEAPAPGPRRRDCAPRSSTPRARLLEPMRYRSAARSSSCVDVDTGEFRFLEVNTRLQVEHAVTEAVTGVDLVEWMVRARGGRHRRASPPPPIARADGSRDRGAGLRRGSGARLPCRAPGCVTEARWPDRRARRHLGATPAPRSRRSTTRCSPRSIVHAPTARDAVDALRDALDAHHASRGIETNRRAASRSFVDAPTVPRRRRSTPRRSSAHRHARARSRCSTPGSSRPCRTCPGGVGLWHVGVPPSGPMDDRSFRARQPDPRQPPTARRASSAPRPGPRCASTPTTVVCLAGARPGATLDGEPVAVVRRRSRSRPAPTLALGAATAPGCARTCSCAAASTSPH